MRRFPGGWALRRAIVLTLTGALAATVVGAAPVSASGSGDHVKATTPDNRHRTDERGVAGFATPSQDAVVAAGR